MNSFIGIKNQLVHKGIQHLHVSKQATKISEIRLHYLGYKHIVQTSFGATDKQGSSQVEQTHTRWRILERASSDTFPRLKISSKFRWDWRSARDADGELTESLKRSPRSSSFATVGKKKVGEEGEGWERRQMGREKERAGSGKGTIG